MKNFSRLWLYILPTLLIISGFCERTFLEAALAADRSSAIIYVATQGNDKWSGRSATFGGGDDGPVATIERAQSIIRAIKNSGGANRPLKVLIREGIYDIETPLKFTPEDSGTQEGPITYGAYPGEHPILSGGRRLSDWTSRNGRWHQKLRPQTSWSFINMFYGTKRLYTPRLPKHGYFKVDQDIERSDSDEAGYDQLHFVDKNIKSDFHNVSSIQALIIHNWSISRIPLARVDASEHITYLAGRTLNSHFRIAKGTQFRLDNVYEALEDPGDFYHDEVSGDLFYVPESGQKLENASIFAPKIETIIYISGSHDNGPSTEYIIFDGLTFAYTNWVIPPNGSSLSQAAIGMPAAIEAKGARHIVFSHLTMRNLGGYGIALSSGCNNDIITGNVFTDLGGGAIAIGDGSVPLSESVINTGADHFVGANTVMHNRVQLAGRSDPAAVGIWVGRSSGNVITDNDISDQYYTGISIGWTWGYGSSMTAKNTISGNIIHDIGKGVLSDMGGIYTLGISPQTIISENIIFDVVASHYGGWGIYNDEGSTGIWIHNNIVYNTSSEGYFLHYGRDLLVENNIFALGGEGQIGIAPDNKERSLIFRHNVVYWDNKLPPYRGPWRKYPGTSRNNILFNPRFNTWNPLENVSMAVWKSDYLDDQNSLILDPGFINPKIGNFQLRPDSPVLNINLPIGHHLKSSPLFDRSEYVSHESFEAAGNLKR